MVRRHRKGFTLIEILVVIGIILVLIGIGVIGFQHLDKVASEKATKADLEICNSLLTEYQSDAGSLSLVEGGGPLDMGSVYLSLQYCTPSSDNYNLPDPVSPSQGPVHHILPLDWSPPPNVPNYATDDVNLGGQGRGTLMITKTSKILQLCARTAQGKAIVSQIPSSSVLSMGTGSPASFVVLDAWKNPIIYVPAQGLEGVSAGGQQHLVVQAVDGRPFWASAGQDGNFLYGDDNIYSTQVSYTPIANYSRY